VAGVGGDAVRPATFFFARIPGSWRRLPRIAFAAACGSFAFASEAGADRRILIRDAVWHDQPCSVLVVDGTIEAVESNLELLPGDSLVSARGGRIEPGRRRVFDRVPEWSETLVLPAEGITSVVLPAHERERRWLRRVRAAAAWIGPEEADRDGTPEIRLGERAEILVYDPASGELSQAVIGDRVLRRADLATRAEMIARSERERAELPAPEPGHLSFAIDAAGLRVGRLDCSPDGRRIRERQVSPVRSDRGWERTGGAGAWRVTLVEDGRPAASIEIGPDGVRAFTEERSEIILPNARGEPFVELAALPLGPLGPSADLLRISEGELASFPVISLEIVEGRLVVTPGQVSLRRLGPDDSPWTLGPGQRAFSVLTAAGGGGYLLCDPQGLPLRAAETTPAGIVEWIRSPLPTRPAASGATNSQLSSPEAVEDSP